MYEDPNCVDCKLHTRCKTVCLPSQGGLDCSLAIFLDYPSVVEDKRGKSFVNDTSNLLFFLLRRMGVPREKVYLDYILKCHPGKLEGKKHEKRELIDACSQYRFATLQDMPNLRAVCGLGSLACEALIGSKSVGDYSGAKWRPIESEMRDIIDEIWIGYSPGYAVNSPAESGAIFRVIWKAAEEAGLNPTVTKTTMFNFEV